MLRPMILAALIGLAALGGLATTAPAAAAGFGHGGGGPGMRGPGGIGHGHVARGPRFDRGRVRDGARGAGSSRYGRREFGRDSYGYGGSGYGLPLATDLTPRGSPVSPVVGSENVDIGTYRIVTAPGIVERPPGQPVVYVLNGSDGRDAAEPRRNAGGARIVTLSVPRR